MRCLAIGALTIALASGGSVSCAIADTPHAQRPATNAPSIAGYQHVGTYEHIATPMGGSISVLMTSGGKLRIAPVDATRYVNIPLDGVVPAMRLGGRYGVNGRLETYPDLRGDVFLVDEIEHLGGGQAPSAARERVVLPDFFTVDADARGPLTLDELQIRFPPALSRYFDAEAQACVQRQVEIRAAELGDPQAMQPIRRVLITTDRDAWVAMSNADKRLGLARYLVSMAMGQC